MSRKHKRGTPPSTTRGGTEREYRAGCGRTWPMRSDAPDLAYTRLEFPECPACPHRVRPDGGPDFCTLRPQGAPHPFAGLAGLSVPDEPDSES